MTSVFTLNYFNKALHFFNSDSNIDDQHYDNDNNIINLPRKTAPVKMRYNSNTKNTDTNAQSSYLTCMNCGNFINEFFIETHSSKCFSISNEVTITNENELKASNFKLEKLKSHLIELNKANQNKNYYVNVIIIYIEELFSNNDPISSKKQIRKMIKNINSLAKTYKGSFDIHIYLDRLKVLLNNRLIIYKKRNRQKGQRESVSKQTSKSYDIENLSSINSINDNVSICTLNDMTNMSGSDMNDDTEASNKEKGDSIANENNNMDTKEMYKAFSGKVLKIKFEKYSHNYLIKQIQCKLLFIECVKQQIPFSNWDNFIMKEMAHNCMKYIKKTSKIAIKKMDTINEEEF